MAGKYALASVLHACSVVAMARKYVLASILLDSCVVVRMASGYVLLQCEYPNHHRDGPSKHVHCISSPEPTLSLHLYSTRLSSPCSLPPNLFSNINKAFQPSTARRPSLTGSLSPAPLFSFMHRDTRSLHPCSVSSTDTPSVHPSLPFILHEAASKQPQLIPER